MKRVILLICSLFVVILPNQLVQADKMGKLDSNAPHMKVHFIDVGQGDSILIELPNRKTVLIDGGPPKAGRKVVDYLKKENIKQLDLIVATHPDIDHIGGLIPVLATFEVNKLVDSGKLYYTNTYLDYLKVIEQHNIPVTIAKSNETIKLAENIRLKMLNHTSNFSSNNEASISLALRYKDMDFLFMGDVEQKQEKAIADLYNVEAEFLKVAHHGSATSSSYQFLQEVRPERAILSYAKDNPYGHPVRDVVDRLLEVGTTIYSTAKLGNIVVTTDGEAYMIETTGRDRLIYNIS
ncbi:ComEC/Rec2 family competence protein [Aquibacillus salsiterrae]|uniref:MBL fold metallo-hydrolase n=1 Tax=Aquibacillus salsiterrae TaxID=2950439 RepID=A0A9X4AG05_9BACI|nr:ComEC/Rec2 family competence protein [Aquibacillus salsiterrae]MDC3418179.1 MBL fold metallo-hydrolase [Aquibacillus salsiterrae]